MLAREKSTFLAELFSVELKFTMDVLNDWFSDTIKPKFLDVNDIKKQIFVKENPTIPSKTTCSICGFLLDVQARGEHKRWYDFIIECEYLFLRNIYNHTDLQKMKIEDIEKYNEIFNRLVELFPVVESALEYRDTCVEFEDFMSEELDNVYSSVSEMKEDIGNVVVTKKIFCKPPDFSDKIISFIYFLLIKFVETDKVKGIPTSKNFIENLKGIIRNITYIHHSHISEEIIGYAHSYCNYKVRENRTKIGLVAHNLFRFDFFFLSKGLRADVWRYL